MDTLAGIIYPPRFGKDYNLWYIRGMYILPIGGLYNPYHLLGVPETAIEPEVFVWPVSFPIQLRERA